ncbi:MAG: hypothetical protein R3E10_10660 [Gemmatimonadota bacterium]
MSTGFSSVLRRLAPALVALPFLLPAPAAGQSGEGFLFGSPRGSIAFKAGYAMPTAGSQIFDFVSDELTLSKRDFNAPWFEGEIGVRVSDRVDVLFDVAYSRSERDSEFRDWTDTNDLPIEQRTMFRRVPVSLGFKYYLGDTGRRISSLAWVPAKWTPYVGAGAGIIWYRFSQVGDFVDFETLDIFVDNFISEGHSGTVHALAGVDYSLSARAALTGEARYQYAKGPMGADFVDFDDLDLAGFQVTAGLKFRF